MLFIIPESKHHHGPLGLIVDGAVPQLPIVRTPIIKTDRSWKASKEAAVSTEQERKSHIPVTEELITPPFGTFTLPGGSMLFDFITINFSAMDPYYELIQSVLSTIYTEISGSVCCLRIQYYVQ